MHWFSLAFRDAEAFRIKKDLRNLLLFTEYRFCLTAIFCLFAFFDIRVLSEIGGSFFYFVIPI